MSRIGERALELGFQRPCPDPHDPLAVMIVFGILARPGTAL
jgi:hypothetical protein